MYCGGTIVVREAIHAAAVASLPNLLRLARTATQSRNYREAYEYFTRVLEADADNWEAWAGKAEASGLMAGPQEVRLQEIVTCFANALQSAPEQEREGIQHRIAEVVDQVAGQYYTQMRSHYRLVLQKKLTGKLT
jgi:tetratricopeptide (TPR) repeat protein